MLEGWRRAGAKIRTARTRAGHRNIAAFARVCGLGYTTISDLETGRRTNFSHRVLDRVEAELGWPAGEIEHLAAGGRPRRGTYPDDLAEVIRAWPKLGPRERVMLVQAVRAALPRDST